MSGQKEMATERRPRRAARSSAPSAGQGGAEQAQGPTELLQAALGNNILRAAALGEESALAEVMRVVMEAESLGGPKRGPAQVANSQMQSAMKAGAGAWPGGRAGRAIQRRAGAGASAADSNAVRVAAAEGTSGAASSLPHMDRIQEAFGDHDISGILAHMGERAAAANAQIGAEAFATGENIAFGSASPTLHTVAHEAAHVVQQRGGVHLSDGVGSVGDVYERSADAVADLVVRGESAAGLLDQMAPVSSEGSAGGLSGGGLSAGAASGGIQKKALQFDIKEDLRKAMEGWGTDEAAIFARVERAGAEEIKAVMEDKALLGELRGELSNSDLGRVFRALHAPLADRLRLAMEGWGADSDIILQALQQADAAELTTVAGDAALVNQLQSELSGANMKTVLDRLQIPLSRKLKFATDGWGTDEDYIYTATAAAPVAEALAIANDPAALAMVDGDLSGEELDRWRGTLAKRAHDSGDDILAFKLCVSTDASRARRLAWIGDLAVQRLICDVVIQGSTDGDSVRQAFQSYWAVELDTAAGATTWPVATLQAMHGQLKLLPDQDSRAGVWNKLTLTSDPLLISRAAYGGGNFSVGSNASTTSTIPMGYGTTLAAAAAAGDTSLTVAENRFKVGDAIDLDAGGATFETVTISAIAGTTYTVSALTKAHVLGGFVGSSGGGGLRNVNWLTATVRHEIAHSIEGVVDCTGFKQGIGGWWTGADFETWATAMGTPWVTNDGSAIAAADQASIKSTIEEYVHGAKGTLTALPADHAITRLWGKDIPVVKAAEACLSKGDDFFNSPTGLYQSAGKVFTCSNWYKTFQYCNAGVLSDRISNYSLYAAAEFFAETYTVFYEEAGLPGVTDADLGRHIKNGTWSAWMRSNVHLRGHAPAPPAAAGPATPPSTTPAPGASPVGDGRAGGASHGRAAKNPN